MFQFVSNSLVVFVIYSFKGQRTCCIDASVEWCRWTNYVERGGEGRDQRRVNGISYLATASSTWGSCSHLLRASTLLVFRCGRLSMKIASAHRIPEAGHSCMAEKKATINCTKLCFWQFIMFVPFFAGDVARQQRARVHSGQSKKVDITSEFRSLALSYGAASL